MYVCEETKAIRNKYPDVHVCVNRPVAQFVEFHTNDTGHTTAIGRNFTECRGCNTVSVHNSESIKYDFTASKTRPEITAGTYQSLLRTVRNRPRSEAIKFIKSIKVIEEAQY